MINVFLLGFGSGIILFILMKMVSIVAMIWKINGRDVLPHIMVLFYLILFYLWP